MRKILFAAAALALVTSAARAETQIDASVSAGTLGIGTEIGLRLTEYPFGVRLGFNTLDVGHKLKVDGNDYAASAAIQSFGTTLDYYPFGTGLRLSAGMRFGESEVRVRGRSTSSVSIGGRSYAGEDIGTVSGRASFNSVAPYVGIGYGTAFFGGRVPVSLDVGATYIGSADVRLSASGPIANDPQVRADLARESASIRDKANDFQFFPVVMLSVGYRF